MWRKFAGPEFYPSMFKLSPDQRLEIQKLIALIVADPYNIALDPVVLDSSTRENEAASVWLRYRIDDKEKRIIFLRVSI